MVKRLRKYHYIIWRTLAILLPTAVVVAIALRPTTNAEYVMRSGNYYSELIALKDSSASLHIIISRPLNVPSCLVYQIKGNNELLLGKMDRRGEYTFTVATTNGKGDFKIFDWIHKKTISTFSLAAKTAKH